MVARCRPSRRAISLQLRPISIRPHKRHLSPSVRWLYLVPMATPDIAGVALGLWIYAILLRWRYHSKNPGRLTRESVRTGEWKCDETRKPLCNRWLYMQLLELFPTMVGVFECDTFDSD